MTLEFLFVKIFCLFQIKEIVKISPFTKLWDLDVEENQKTLNTLETSKLKELADGNFKFDWPFAKQHKSDSSKLKELADDNFKFDENGKTFSKREENTVGKGKIVP